MQNRVGQLIAGFDQYVEAFDEAQLFTGPSLYFHLKTVKMLHDHGSPTKALQDDAFLESVYATLTAWGMHRMGPRGAKLAEFDQFRTSFRTQSEHIAQIQNLYLGDVKPTRVDKLAQYLWNIISELRVGTSKTKIVAGSKALHHLLPGLVPPIDRQYTTRFFYSHTTYNQGDRKAFLEMFPCFHRIAVSCRSDIEPRLGTGMNTSFTKVIDNAIVGYVLEHLK
jgi:hypothetical protein